MPTRLIQLLINTSTGYGRSLIVGVTQYAHETTGWTTVVPIAGVAAPVSSVGPRPDGMIARVMEPAALACLRRADVPVVCVSDVPKRLGLPTVTCDDTAIGRLAADYLADLRFAHFGYCGFEDFAYSRRRGQAFVRRLRELGKPCGVYPDNAGPKRDLRVELRRLARWITRLPRPLAIFACNDIRGQHVVEACISAGLAVPDDVAVLGVDNDPITCEASYVPLSSIDPGAQTVGYQAAALLDRLMRRRHRPRRPMVIAPVGVVVRRSTDVLMTGDELVRDAMRLMRRPGNPPTSIKQILEELATSRRPLEMRFRAALGRSPGQELTRTRIAQARRLLLETNLSVKQIAARCGYRSATSLAYAFRRTQGQSPGSYRHQHRPAG